MSEFMRTPRKKILSTTVCAVLIAISLCVIGYGTMLFAYSLNSRVGPSLEYGSIHAERVAAFRVAAITTVFSIIGWLWPLARYTRYTTLVAFIQTVIVTFVALALYVVTGFWGEVGETIAPILFFIDWNWLTLLLEVAPVIALSAGILTVAAGRLIRNSSVISEETES